MKVSLFLTERCNGVCEYCDILEIVGLRDMELIEENVGYLEYIMRNCDEISLSGGEVGLLGVDVLDVIFYYIEKYKRKVKVNTNGLFIEKGYFDRYYLNIKEVKYHIIDIESYIDYDNEKIKKCYVLTNKDWDIIYKYGDKDIEWIYNEGKNSVNDLLIEDVKIREKIGKDFYKINERYILLSKGCNFFTRSIDFVKKRIYDCCVSNSLALYEELNIINLEKSFLNKEARYISSCKYCYCLFEKMDVKKIIKKGT